MLRARIEQPNDWTIFVESQEGQGWFCTGSMGPIHLPMQCAQGAVSPVIRGPER